MKTRTIKTKLSMRPPLNVGCSGISIILAYRVNVRECAICHQSFTIYQASKAPELELARLTAAATFYCRLERCRMAGKVYASIEAF